MKYFHIINLIFMIFAVITWILEARTKNDIVRKRIKYVRYTVGIPLVIWNTVVMIAGWI